MSPPAFIKKSLKALKHKGMRKTGRVCALMRIMRFAGASRFGEVDPQRLSPLNVAFRSRESASSRRGEDTARQGGPPGRALRACR
jgi:hypothetical protein